MSAHIAPALQREFDLSPGRQLRVHDAFLVRYAAGAQAHLPLHCDESEYSLTLALNPTADFDGGGTFFAPLRRAISPEVGHLVAFEGKLLHGGEPIMRGTRYVLACFMYVEDGLHVGRPGSAPLDVLAEATAGYTAAAAAGSFEVRSAPRAETAKRQKVFPLSLTDASAAASSSFAFNFT